MNNNLEIQNYYLLIELFMLLEQINATLKGSNYHFDLYSDGSGFLLCSDINHYNLPSDSALCSWSTFKQGIAAVEEVLRECKQRSSKPEKNA